MKKLFFSIAIICFVFGVKAQIIKKEIPDKLVVFSFDDAAASQYSFVAPLLKKYGFGATFYICEFPPNFSDTTKYMNWRQIGELDKMGFEIANHTKSHPKIADLPLDIAEVELAYIDQKCDSMKIAKPTTFAYPGYSLDSSLVEYLADRGFKFARAGGKRPYDPLTDHPLLIPSWAMNGDNKEMIMDAFKQAKEGKVVVMTIHGVPDVEHPWVTTPQKLFTEYVEYLAENDYKVIALRDLEKYINVDDALESIAPDYTKKHR